MAFGLAHREREYQLERGRDSRALSKSPTSRDCSDDVMRVFTAELR